MLIGNRFQLNNKINSGSFGQIHLAMDIKTKQTVAVKMEQINCKHPQLQYQAKLLAYLIDSLDCPRQNGIPRIHYYGKYDKYHVMIMDLLGPSLEQLFQKCNKKFDLKTVVMIGIQIFERLQYLHKKKFIHRDIKPQNFLLGMYQHCDKVFMIDLGLSKKYVTKSGEHIPYRDDRSLKGTPRYTSLNSHLGIEQSRRDDLQSVVYMLIYFLKGQLPWQNLKQDANYDRYEKILQKKLSVSVQNLCVGIPDQFKQLVEYTRNLHFIQQPNYQKIKDLLKQALLDYTGQQYNPKDLYCWQKTQNQEQQQASKLKKTSQKLISRSAQPAKPIQQPFTPIQTFQKPQHQFQQKEPQVFQEQQNFFFRQSEINNQNNHNSNQNQEFNFQGQNNVNFDPFQSKNFQRKNNKQKQFSPFDSDLNDFSKKQENNKGKNSSLMSNSKKKNDDSIDFNVFRKNVSNNLKNGQNINGHNSSQDQGDFKAFQKGRDSLDDDNPFAITKTQRSQDDDNPFGNGFGGFGGADKRNQKRWQQNKKNDSFDDPFGDFKQPKIQEL